jgi:hypothetical protein
VAFDYLISPTQLDAELSTLHPGIRAFVSDFEHDLLSTQSTLSHPLLAALSSVLSLNYG